VFIVKHVKHFRRLMDYWFGMPTRCIYMFVAKIFYCGGSFGRLGVLRAVTPLSDLKPLMFDETLAYVGQSFPAENQKSPAQIVIEIVPDEEDESWNAGFYLIKKGPLHFEDSLRKLCKAASRSI
jgi:hypothetical protein